MKILTKKGFVNKLIIVLLSVIVFGTIVPTNASYAADGDFGGKLLKPIVDLLLALGDLIMDLLHNVVYGMNQSIIKVDFDNGWLEFFVIAAAVVLAIAAVVAIGAGVIAGGAALIKAIGGVLHLTISGAVSATAIGAVLVAAIQGGAAAGMFVRSNLFSNEGVLPIYKISPEEIFTGQVQLLNANFFTDKEVEITDTSMNVVNTVKKEAKAVSYDCNNDEGLFSTDSTDIDNVNKEINEILKKYGYSGDEWKVNRLNNKTNLKWKNPEDESKAFLAEIQCEIEEDSVSGQRLKTTATIIVYEGEWQGSTSIAQELKSTIAKWYYAIRNLALVAMMIILLYIGIRIMLCGVANEKAKYKNMLVDWLVAICLIFVMHYIMVFAMNITESIIQLFSSVNNNKEYIIMMENKNNKITDELLNNKTELGLTENQINELVETIPVIDEEGNTKNTDYVKWDARNILGLIRVQAALDNGPNYIYIGYVMCFLVLVWYTLFFFVTYLKRILYLAFFTVIAPLVAMTYPIDKMHDGKAQAFDMWLKEYIFNLLIQPMHLLLYTVLINSAFNLASENIIYTLVAIGFMMPAEKFVRKMFGFDKAQTPGFLGGAAGAAVALTAFNKVLNRKPLRGGKSQGAYGEKEEKGKEDKVSSNEGIDYLSVANKQGDSTAGLLAPLSNEELKRRSNQSKKQEESKIIDIGQKEWSDILNTNKYGSYKPQIDRVDKINLPKTDGQRKLEEDKKKAKQEAEKKAKLKKHRLRGIKKASKDFAKQKLQRGANYLYSGKPIRDFTRVTTGLTVGTGAAMLGATLGIAAEDPNKVGQYGATLGAAGYALGARDIKTNVDEESIYEEYKRGLYESEDAYRQVLLEEQRQRTIENEKNLKKFRENLKLEDLNEAQEKLEEYGDCIDVGIKDMDDVATVVKLVEQENWDKDMAKSTAKLYKRAGARPSKMTAEQQDNFELMCRNIVSKTTDDETQIRLYVNNMRDNLEKYGSTKDSLTNV